jgi:hypothetical protein
LLHDLLDLFGAGFDDDRALHFTRIGQEIIPTIGTDFARSKRAQRSEHQETSSIRVLVTHLTRGGGGKPEDSLRAVEGPLWVILFKSDISRVQELENASRETNQSARVLQRGVGVEVTRIATKPTQVGREDSAHTPLYGTVKLLQRG